VLDRLSRRVEKSESPRNISPFLDVTWDNIFEVAENSVYAPNLPLEPRRFQPTKTQVIPSFEEMLDSGRAIGIISHEKIRPWFRFHIRIFTEQRQVVSGLERSTAFSDQRNPKGNGPSHRSIFQSFSRISVFCSLRKPIIAKKWQIAKSFSFASKVIILVKYFSFHNLSGVSVILKNI